MANFLLKMFKYEYFIDIPEIDYPITTNTTLLKYISNTNITLHNLPGHTNGSCIIEIGEFVFTGDTFIEKGIINNDLPGENLVLLQQSVEFIKQTFTDGYTFFPGHGNSFSLNRVSKG